MKTIKEIHKRFGWLAGALVSAALIASCGGGGGGSSQPTQQLHNVAAITVDGEFESFNALFVSVQICQHGSTSNCVTVDHVAIDTGSIGLRVLQSSLTSLSAGFLGSVPTVTATSADGTVTGPLAECSQFGGGYTWGSVRNVDISITGTNETASNVPMQVIGDLGDSQTTCANQSVTGFQLSGEDYTNDTANPLTSEYLGSNGLIGVSLFQWDCIECQSTAEPNGGTNGMTPQFSYAACPDTSGNGCSPATVAFTQQVQNPIYGFATDNNGFVIKMPSVTSLNGATSAVNGTWTFGIGTQTNNALGSATKFNADPDEEPGIIQTTWQGATYPGLFDTGSSDYYFTNSTNIALCGTSAPLDQIYCPGGAGATSSTTGISVNLTATIQDYQGDASPSSSVAFTVANPFVYLDSNNIVAADDIGGTVVFQYFIWGMPYFYGRTLYFGLSGISGTTDANLQLTANPYYAF